MKVDVKVGDIIRFIPDYIKNKYPFEYVVIFIVHDGIIDRVYNLCGDDYKFIDNRSIYFEVVNDSRS